MTEDRPPPARMSFSDSNSVPLAVKIPKSNTQDLEEEDEDEMEKKLKPKTESKSYGKPSHPNQAS